jgi:kynureninase
LTTLIAQTALERGFQVNTPLDPEKRTGWIGIVVRAAHDDEDVTERVYHELINRRVFVDYRPGCGLRVSPHFYTTEDEIHRFFKTLEELT